MDTIWWSRKVSFRAGFGFFKRPLFFRKGSVKAFGWAELLAGDVRLTNKGSGDS